MENLRVTQILMLLTMVAMMMMGVTVMAETLHKVGGSKGWKPQVNYTQWSEQERFFVGDWLYFNFNKLYYNVLEVNKTSYENCIDKDFIKNVTRGGRDVVQLTEVRTYYYLSSGGYCFHQMKVAVNVTEGPDPLLIAQAPAPNNSQDYGSGSLIMHYSVCAHALIELLLLLLIMWFI